MLPAVGLYCGIYVAEHQLNLYQVAGFALLMMFLYLFLGKAAIYHQKVLYDSIHQAGKNLKADLLEVMVRNREIAVDSSVLLNDAEKIEEDLFLGGIDLIEQVVFYCIAFGIIFYINAAVAVALFLLSLLIAAVNAKSREKGMVYQAQNSEQQEKQLTFLEQTESGYETILMYQQQERMENQFHQYAEDLYRAQGQLQWHKEKISLITIIFLRFSLPICTLGGNFFILTNLLTVSQIMLIVQLSNYLFKPIRQIMPAWFQVHSVQKTAEKISSLLKQNNRVSSSSPQETKSIENHQKLQMNHGLELHINSFFIQEKEILKSIAFSIKKGEKVLLLGSNGCGKSTLLKYLLGYYGYQQGSIWIDGTDCSASSWESISSVFASVDQNFFLLSGSVKDNIGCFQKLPDTIMQNAVSLCDLEEIIEQKEALKLSGGQMQRIAIARAVASKRSILVFDEAFSAVDAKHHFQIERKLLQNPDLTFLEVVHQIAKENYFLFDKIILMKDGRIIQSGTPQQVQNEPFVKNLWEEKGEEENERK